MRDVARGRARGAALAATLAADLARAAPPAEAGGPSADGPPAPSRTLTWHPGADQGAARGAAGAAQERRPAEERPFAFVTDPTTPARGDVGLEYRLGLASGTLAERPLPVDPSVNGVEQNLSVDYGVTSRLAPSGTVSVFQAKRGESAPEATGALGVRFQLSPPESRLRGTLGSAVFREFGGAFGWSGVAAGSLDVRRLRVASTLHAERVFEANRDPVDVVVLLGASYSVLDALRVGVEYVGQDLEELGEDGPDAEGGASQFVGPSVSVELMAGALRLYAGGARELGGAAAPLVGRAGALMAF